LKYKLFYSIFLDSNRPLFRSDIKEDLNPKEVDKEMDLKLTRTHNGNGKRGPNFLTRQYKSSNTNSSILLLS